MNQPTISDARCWALIHQGINGASFVVASCAIVSTVAEAAGWRVEDLDLPVPAHFGFWLWEGHYWTDGADGWGWERTRSPQKLLSYRGAAERMAQHEKALKMVPRG